MTETTNLELKKPEKTNFVSIGDFNLNSDKIDKLGAPEFDDSGVVDGITDFTTYLSTLVSGSSIFNFFRNLKAGFQYVLHVGQLVNNTVTNNDNLPASASAVYKLQQSLNTTNSNLGNKGAYSGDLNDIPFVNNILTVYRADSACANIPTTGYAGIVETLYIDSASNAIQRFVSLDSVQSSWIRRKFNGTWGNWTKNLTSGGAYDGDLNNIPFITANVPTFYRAAETCANIPSADYPGVVETLYVDSSAYAIQRFTSMDATSSFWVRRKYNGTWGAWVSK